MATRPQALPVEALGDWVPILVPRTMAPAVLRGITSWVTASGDDGVRDWGDATTAEKRDFFAGIPALEWRLVTELADHDKAITSAELAANLGVEVGDIAGAVGPLNKRAKKIGWASPVRTEQHWHGPGRTVRGLVLHDELKAWVSTRASDLLGPESGR